MIEKKHKHIGILTDDNSLKMLDWVIFAVLAGFCFFTMQHTDIAHTGGSSFSLLNGHLLDFYDYTAEYMVGNNYMISTYILFAIWNIPIRLLGLIDVPTMVIPYGVLMWYKALPTLFYILSAYLIYRIGVQVGLGQNKSKVAAYTFLTMPIAFYSQLVFGQYDIFTVFFVLLGLSFYFKAEDKSLHYFSLLLGIACTFKYFAFLIFVPLLVLREKKITNLLKHMLFFSIPLLIVIVPYLPSEAFQDGVFGFEATSFVLVAGIDVGFGRTSLMPVAWIATCLFAFLHEEITIPKELFQWAIYFGNMVSFFLFSFTLWHPQWLMFAVPFWVFGLIISKRIDVSCLLDIAMMIFFSVYISAEAWHGSVTEGLWNYGAFSSLIEGRTELALKLRDVYGIDISLAWTCFVGILLANTIIKHPKYCMEDLSASIKESFNWIRARFIVGLSVFLIPMLICLFSAINSPKLIYEPSPEAITVTAPIQDGQIIEQIFVSNANVISSVDVMLGTYERTNNFTLKAAVVDAETEEVLATKDINTAELIDNSYEHITFEPIPVKEGKQYRIRFYSEGADETNAVAIYRTNDTPVTESCYAQIDGVPQSFDLLLKVYDK